ncbi:hypothetical protein [Armatimonas sp.]|uniref:hypothetical protein n=1 Tax=Armatimonas sp. TaxID=1872638 RepID=UPI00286BCC10|nr:hypothetical protein [Armatimonas sp.]
MTTTRADDEIIDLLATAPQMLDYRPSDEARERFWELVQLKKDGTLTIAEQIELEHYNRLEHLVRMAKAQARQKHPQAA